MPEQWKPPFEPGQPAPGIGADEQRVFDTVTGPNLRMKDNLIQGLAILGGIVAGAVAGVIVQLARGQTGDSVVGGAIGGGFAGLLLATFLSGTIIGVVRGAQAIKRR